MKSQELTNYLILNNLILKDQIKTFPVTINMYACTLIKSLIYVHVAQNSICFCFALLIHVCIYTCMLSFVLELKGYGGDPT